MTNTNTVILYRKGKEIKRIDCCNVTITNNGIIVNGYIGDKYLQIAKFSNVDYELKPKQ